MTVSPNQGQSRLADQDHAPASSPREVRKVMFSSFLGTTIEYYDFLLYATASGVVFSQVFFSDLPAWAATLTSFGTLAIGYVARPLGGIIFGHFGDKYGRKRMLVITMMIMGIASTLIGCLPTSEQIGPMAGIMLVTLRALQGIAIGGEWGGAVLMSAEHSSSKKRGFSASWTNSGAPAGSVLGTLVFALFSTMPEDAFYSYGWRIPFLLSALLLVIGLFVRHSISESPVFLKALKEAESKPRTKTPLMEILKRPGTVLRIAVAFMANPAISILFPTVGVIYAVKHGTEQGEVLLIMSLAMFVQIFTIPAFAALSDRIGRKPVMIGALALASIWVGFFFPALASGNLGLIALLYFIGLPLIHAALIGPLPSFLSEQFRTEERYTGLSVGYQLSSLVGGFTPLILTAIMGPDLHSGGAIAFLVCVYLVSAVFLFTLKDRSTKSLHNLDA